MMMMMMMMMTMMMMMMMSYYKAAGLRYSFNRSTKTVINVDVASLVIAS